MNVTAHLFPQTWKWTCTCYLSACITSLLLTLTIFQSKELLSYHEIRVGQIHRRPTRPQNPCRTCPIHVLHGSGAYAHPTFVDAWMRILALTSSFSKIWPLNWRHMNLLTLSWYRQEKADVGELQLEPTLLKNSVNIRTCYSVFRRNQFRSRVFRAFTEIRKMRIAFPYFYGTL